jgi:hypothetical protein
MECHYSNLLRKLNLPTLHFRRRHFSALFLKFVSSVAKFCTSVLETVGIPVPTRNIHNFTTFYCPSSHIPSARGVSVDRATAQAVSRRLPIAAARVRSQARLCFILIRGWLDAPSGLSLTTTHETKRKTKCASAANAVCKSIDSFKNSRLNINNRNSYIYIYFFFAYLFLPVFLFLLTL